MPKIVASKSDWIALGYKLFSEDGESGLIVEQMSRVLTCNKSSFYWHFKTKEDFIDSLIEYWIGSETTRIIEEVEKCLKPKEKLHRLIELAYKKDANLDFIFYLKKYAQGRQDVRKIVEEIDGQRMIYVCNLLIGIGFELEIAEMKASVFYKHLIGYHEMIRYDDQYDDYLVEVLQEINQFINLENGIEK